MFFFVEVIWFLCIYLCILVRWIMICEDIKENFCLVKIFYFGMIIKMEFIILEDGKILFLNFWLS